MSTLNVDKVAPPGSTTGITFQDDGARIDGGFIHEIDQFYLQSNDTQDGDDNVLSDWVRNDKTGFTKVGTGLTNSSGTFSFGITGYYRLIFVYQSNTDSNGDMTTGVLKVTTNNSTYNTVAIALNGDASGDANQCGMCMTYVNCTDVDQVKFRCQSESMDSDSHTEGNTGQIRTSIAIERIAPAQ